MDPASLLRRSAWIHADRTACVCDGRRQTHAELYERACRLANALRDAGIEPGDRVALLGDNAFESIEQIAGLALGNYVRCGLYAHETADKHRYLLELTGARALIVAASHYDVVAPLIDELPELSCVLVAGDGPDGVASYEGALARASTDDPRVPLREDDPHLIRFSAGTTGKPKGILHTVRGFHDMGAEYALTLGGYAEDDAYVAAGPLTHAAGLLTWPLIGAGAVTIVMPAFDPARLLELIEAERATLTIVVPTMIQMLVGHPDARTRDLSSLRQVIYGAAPISETTLTAALDVWGNIMYQIYGQSETMPLTTLRPSDHRQPWLRSAGRPSPNTVLRIVDEDGNELPCGEVGEIEARCPGTMAGIWGDPEATAQRVDADGWVSTRDMGSLSEDGFLYLADRKEDMIISGGFNIWPVELENALAAHPAVAEAAVVGVPHEKWGETPQALVVLRDGASATEQELIDWTRDKCGAVKKVTAVHFGDELPKTPIGKVLRRAVREELSDTQAGIVGA